MASLAPPARDVQSAPTTPVRHGLCRLTLTIDGTDYRLSRSPTARAAWHLKKRSGPRAGITYCVRTHKNVVSCTCYDSINTGAVCKHVLALKALGLVAKGARPEALIAPPTGGNGHA